MRLRPGIELEDWQRDAVAAYRGDGVAEVPTGLGKTLLALALAVRATCDGIVQKVAVVVPTRELARQWVAEVRRRLDVDPGRVGLVDTDARDTFNDHDVLVFVLASARMRNATRLRNDATRWPLMLIVDEAHTLGAPGASALLEVPAKRRVGLTATAARTADDALDESGAPLPRDAQAHVLGFGGVFFAISIGDAVRRGWMPPFEIHHHALEMTDDEAARHDLMASRIREVRRAIRGFGEDPDGYRKLAGASGPVGDLARELRDLYLARKDHLYRASERDRVAVRILADALASDRPPRQIALFHERQGGEEVRGAESVHRAVLNAIAAGVLPLRADEVVLEHSGLRKHARMRAVDSFRVGRARVIVSAKALQEGIDLPSLDLVVTLASSSSPLRRVQVVGRGLRAFRDALGRRAPDGRTKQIHHLYVGRTTDAAIYAGRNPLGDIPHDRIRWWWWPLLGEAGVRSTCASLPTPAGHDGGAAVAHHVPRVELAPMAAIAHAAIVPSRPLVPQQVVVAPVTPIEVTPLQLVDALARCAPRHRDLWHAAWEGRVAVGRIAESVRTLEYPEAVAIALYILAPPPSAQEFSQTAW